MLKTITPPSEGVSSARKRGFSAVEAVSGWEVLPDPDSSSVVFRLEAQSLEQCPTLVLSLPAAQQIARHLRKAVKDVLRVEPEQSQGKK